LRIPPSVILLIIHTFFIYSVAVGRKGF